MGKSADVGQIYLRWLNKVNKNSTNDNVIADKGRFVEIFNEAQNRYMEWILEKRNEDDIRYIQKLRTPDKKLKKGRTILNHCDFELPEDYFEFDNLQVFGAGDGCKEDKIHVFEAKQENVEELLCDEANKPSFPYRETFYTITDDHVNVYFEDFSISKVYLTYYRCPVQIDIEGYIRHDGTQSTNINSEWDDRVINRILNAATQQFHLNSDNLQRIQFDKDSIFSKV